MGASDSGWTDGPDIAAVVPSPAALVKSSSVVASVGSKASLGGGCNDAGSKAVVVPGGGCSDAGSKAAVVPGTGCTDAGSKAAVVPGAVVRTLDRMLPSCPGLAELRHRNEQPWYRVRVVRTLDRMLPSCPVPAAMTLGRMLPSCLVPAAMTLCQTLP